MTEFLLHFFIGLAGSGLVYFVFWRLSAARSNSVPFGLVFLGLACGILAIYLTPWATLGVLLVYAAASVKELIDDRRDASSHSGSDSADS